MITSSHIISEIDEVYLGLVSGFPKVEPAPVFMNPDRSEFLELPKPIRFAAHLPNKSVYVWEALAALHFNVEIELKLDVEAASFGSTEVATNSLWGSGINLGPRGEMRESDTLDFLIHRIDKRDVNKAYNILKQYYETEWSWAERYISGIHDFLDKSLLAFVKKWKKVLP
jgi:hypothetical protein